MPHPRCAVVVFVSIIQGIDSWGISGSSSDVKQVVVSLGRTIYVKMPYQNHPRRIQGRSEGARECGGTNSSSTTRRIPHRETIIFSCENNDELVLSFSLFYKHGMAGDMSRLR